MDILENNILLAVLVFSWMMYLWEEYLGYRQVISYNFLSRYVPLLLDNDSMNKSMLDPMTGTEIGNLINEYERHPV